MLQVPENNDIDVADLEAEQIDYITRNSGDITIPDQEMYPDPLKKPLERPVVLDPIQKKKLIEEIKRQIPYSFEETKKTKYNGSFSLTKYIDIISESFIEIMDDLLSFDGDLEQIPAIFTKNERLVLVATVIIVLSLYIIFGNK